MLTAPPTIRHWRKDKPSSLINSSQVTSQSKELLTFDRNKDDETRAFNAWAVAMHMQGFLRPKEIPGTSPQKATVSLSTRVGFFEPDQLQFQVQYDNSGFFGEQCYMKIPWKARTFFNRKAAALFLRPFDPTLKANLLGKLDNNSLLEVTVWRYAETIFSKRYPGKPLAFGHPNTSSLGTICWGNNPPPMTTNMDYIIPATLDLLSKKVNFGSAMCNPEHWGNAQIAQITIGITGERKTPFSIKPGDFLWPTYSLWACLEETTREQHRDPPKKIRHKRQLRLTSEHSLKPSWFPVPWSNMARIYCDSFIPKEDNKTSTLIKNPADWIFHDHEDVISIPRILTVYQDAIFQHLHLHNHVHPNAWKTLFEKPFLTPINGEDNSTLSISAVLFQAWLNAQPTFQGIVRESIYCRKMDNDYNEKLRSQKTARAQLNSYTFPNFIKRRTATNHDFPTKITSDSGKTLYLQETNLHYSGDENQYNGITPTHTLRNILTYGHDEYMG